MLTSSGLDGTKQPVHWLIDNKDLGMQQGTSIWVGSPKSSGYAFIHLRYILKIPLKWSVILPESPISTGNFSNWAGSSITNRRLSPSRDVIHLEGSVDSLLQSEKAHQFASFFTNAWVSR